MQDAPNLLQERLLRDSYALVPDALAGEDLTLLRAAGDRLASRCREGTHPVVRRAPGGEDTWGAGDLFAPTAFEPALIEAMCAPRIVEVTEVLLGPARLAVISFLFAPERERWEGRWHRDPVVREPERLRALTLMPPWCVQWNVPLHPDASLEIVPGSGNRESTPAEQATLATGFGEMPGAISPELAAGAGVVYTPMLIHRGVYRPERPRLTLHFAWQRREEPDSRIPDRWPRVPPEALERLSPRCRECLGMPR